MKKIVLGLAVGTLLTTSAAFAADVRIGTEGAYAPWNFLDDSGKLAGYEIELGNELCKRAGVSLSLIHISEPRDRG